MNCEWIETTYQNKECKTTVKTIEPKENSNTEFQVVNIYPRIPRQIFDGFGGAVTESTAYTWSQMSPKMQDELLEAYFGSTGIGYRFVRISLDSCDFSLGHYSAIKDKNDIALQTFTLDRDKKYVIPFLQAAEKKLQKKIQILISPWSPPAFMKTNGTRNHGGGLKPECRQLWADYICRYIQEYRNLGFQVNMLTVQNEPNAAQSWDSCQYSPEQEKKFLRDFLYPTLQRNGLSHVEIYIWDHNKESAVNRAEAIIDTDTRNMVTGVAFHWYSGEHFDALRILHELYPEKKLIFTEGCVEYSRFRADNQLANARMYAHEIMGNLNGGANIFFDWNMILNEQGGPNHVGNYCDAPILCDTITDTFEKKLSFIYISHFSRFIHPGAVHVSTTQYSDQIDVTAFENPDSSIVAVLMNRTSEQLTVNLRMEGKVIAEKLAPDTIVTAVFA